MSLFLFIAGIYKQLRIRNWLFGCLIVEVIYNGLILLEKKPKKHSLVEFDVDRVELFRLTLRFVHDISTAS